MSRIGRAPITVPAGVEIKVADDNTVTVKGPKGTLSQKIVPQISVELGEGVINVTRDNDSKESRSLHGLSRTLINNMVVGVTEGFSKKLEINGVGYRASKEGKNLVMNLGNHVVINGIDKQKVGQFAAEVRGKRPPEPYKGKGIKYDYEHIRRKEGKTGAK